MNIYNGFRLGSAIRVTVNGNALNSRCDLLSKSPSELDWGCKSDGSDQLALALLANRFGDDNSALKLYLGFSHDVITKLPYTRWSLTTYDIDRYLENCS